MHSLYTGVAVARARAAVDQHRPDVISTDPLGLTQCRQCGRRWPSAVWTPPERRGCPTYRAARAIIDATTVTAQPITVEWRTTPTRRRRWFTRHRGAPAVTAVAVARAIGIARIPTAMPA